MPELPCQHAKRTDAQIASVCLMTMAVRAYQSKWRIQRGDRKEKTDTAPDPFIIATGRDSLKPDAKSLKFIRHHAMKGKNRKQTPPRSHNTACVQHGITEHIPLQNAIVEPVWFRTLDMDYLPSFHPILPSGMLHTVCQCKVDIPILRSSCSC